MVSLKARNLEDSENLIRFNGFLSRNQARLIESCPSSTRLITQGLENEKMEILKLDSDYQELPKTDFSEFFMELLNVLASEYKEDAEILLLKANISLYVQGHYWKSIEYLVRAAAYDKPTSVEHAGYLLSNLI